MNEGRTPARERSAPAFGLDRKVELTLWLFILLAAGGLRLWRLEEVPPGFTHDEAGHGHDAVAILGGDRPLYQTVGYGREPLYDYATAGLMGLLGPSGVTLRLTSVLFGLATLLLTYAWTRSAFDGPTALAAAGLQAASFWSLATSRQALRSGLLPALFAAAVYFYWRSVPLPPSNSPRQGENLASPPLGGTEGGIFKADETSSRSHYWQVGLFALCIGATLYSYLPARVLWTVFPLFLLYLALFHRSLFRRAWLPTLAGVLAGLLLAAPLFVYLQAHPGAEQRLDMLDAPLQALSEGDPSVLLNRIQGAAAGFLLPGQGDDFLAYAIPGRPVFDPLTGALFLAGLGVCLARWREPACAFASLWFAVGVSPSLITGATASSTRGIGALPVAFLFPALAVVTSARWVAGRWGTRAARGVGLACAGLVLVTGALAARDYFVVWGESVDVRAAYQHTLVEMARELETQPGDGVTAVSTLYPHAPHDPYVWQVSLRGREARWSPFTPAGQPLASSALRWFDARRALVLPPEPVARLAVLSSASLDPYFADLPGLRPRSRVSLRDDDLDPFFDLHDWEPPVTLAALQALARGSPRGLTLPVDLGPLQFLGYDLRTPVLPLGGTVELITLWRVVDPEPLRPPDLADANAGLVLFTHALDATGIVVGQEDRLDAPAWAWQAGDVVAQIHRFPLQADLPPGPVTLQVGAYRRADLTRLPALVDGVVVGDRILLQAIEVTGQ